MSAEPHGDFLKIIWDPRKKMRCIEPRYIEGAVYIEELPNIHHPYQFDLSQGHNRNRHFQWKSVGFHWNRHIILRPLHLGPKWVKRVGVSGGPLA